MTFKKRLWNTITLTILIFLVRLHSAPLLGRLDFSTSEVSKIYNLSLLIVCVPFLLFVIQSIFYYLFKKDYPVQNRAIKHPVLRILGWIIIIAPVALYYFLNYQDRRMHSDGGYILSAMVAFGFLFITPLYWLWIIKELKDNYGTKTGIGTFLLILFGFFIYAHFSTSCPADKPLKSYNGCHACDELETISMNHPEDCTKFCPERYRDRYDCLFATKSCPEDKPLKRVGRNVIMGQNFEKGESDCYTCDEMKDLRVSNCYDCPNREMKGESCVLKECPKEFPLRDKHNGKCISCDVLEGVSVDNCGVCSNRKEYWSPTNYENCFLEVCPPEAPIRDIDGACRKCDENYAFKLKDNDDCTRICPNERMLIPDEYYPSRKYCGLINCPEGMKHDYQGFCYKIRK